LKPGLDVNLFYLAFAAYLIGFLVFSLYASLKAGFWHRLGSGVMIAGSLLHSAAFVTRWILSGHIPLSNMYDYLSAMSLMAVLTLLFVYYRYRRPVIGSFISPVVLMLMVAAALLPKELDRSLMPALQSVWLNIHVSLAALGAGCFLVAFAISSIYLLRRYNPDEAKNVPKSKAVRLTIACLAGIPVGLAVIASVIGLTPPSPESRIGQFGDGFNAGSIFILLGIGFILGIILLTLLWPRGGRTQSGFGGWMFIAVTAAFLSGGLVEEGLLRTGWLILTHSFPAMGAGQPVKSAWLIFEFFGAAYLVGLLLSPVLLPLLARAGRASSDRLTPSLDLLDEISYKAVSLGYPLYTVGALFAGAIWAEQAWGSFWSWDPKEVGALIVWLFYSGYLHARYQRGWKGARAAMLVVAGFLMVLLSFFGNYFFGGLHTYI